MYKVKLTTKDGELTISVYVNSPKEIYDWIDNLIDCLNSGRYEVLEDTTIPVARP